MKTLTLVLIAFIFSSNVVLAHGEKDRPRNKKEKGVEASVEKQVQKHLFFPVNKADEIEGTADILLEVFPNGNMRAVTIRTSNPVVKRFVENQVSKMKVDSQTGDVGKLFRYRLTFKSN